MQRKHGFLLKPKPYLPIAILIPIAGFILGLLLNGYDFIYTLGQLPLIHPKPFSSFSTIGSYHCELSYSVEILSFDPLVLYINNFLADTEIEHLLDE